MPLCSLKFFWETKKSHLNQLFLDQMAVIKFLGAHQLKRHKLEITKLQSIVRWTVEDLRPLLNLSSLLAFPILLLWVLLCQSKQNFSHSSYFLAHSFLQALKKWKLRVQKRNNQDQIFCGLETNLLCKQQNGEQNYKRSFLFLYSLKPKIFCGNVVEYKYCVLS